MIRLQNDVGRLKKQVVKLKTNIGKDHDRRLSEIEDKMTGIESNINSSIRHVRKNQADINVRLDNMQAELQSLTGKTEECQYQLDRQKEEYLSLKTTHEPELEKRLLVLEGLILSEGDSSGGKERSKDESHGEAKGEISPEEKEPTAPALYAQAYENFKKGDIEAARVGFRQYLSLFPDTEYSDNAQYWLGEFFFVEKKYREAIVAFDDVIKKYPKGNKIPSALLKQGLAFYKLGDKTNATLLLQKVVKAYPSSNQAKIARKELEKLTSP